jgi:hypothetical protein
MRLTSARKPADDDEKHHALLRQHAAARAKAVMTENLNKAADFDEQVSAERAQAEMAGESERCRCSPPTKPQLSNLAFPQ